MAAVHPAVVLHDSETRSLAAGGAQPLARPADPTPREAPGFWRRAGSVLREHAEFVNAFLRSPRMVGAICPSSRTLARAMIAGADLARARLVVELGPGTGSFTRAILQALGPETKFFALELDPRAIDRLRQRLPGAQVFHDSAERIGHHVRAQGCQNADLVVSGLPWANMPREVQQRIMSAVADALVPGGVFTTFAYVHSRLTPAAGRYWDLLPTLFSQVTVSALVWRNVPPALVYRCVK